MNDWVEVASVQALKPGTVVQVELDEEPIALANIGGELFALDDICSHEYALLSEGSVEDHQIECPLHGSLFDLRTGEAINPPATAPVRTYDVKVDGDRVSIKPKETDTDD